MAPKLAGVRDEVGVEVGVEPIWGEPLPETLKEDVGQAEWEED